MMYNSHYFYINSNREIFHTLFLNKKSKKSCGKIKNKKYTSILKIIWIYLLLQILNTIHNSTNFKSLTNHLFDRNNSAPTAYYLRFLMAYEELVKLNTLRNTEDSRIIFGFGGVSCASSTEYTCEANDKISHPSIISLYSLIADKIDGFARKYLPSWIPLWRIRKPSFVRYENVYSKNSNKATKCNVKSENALELKLPIGDIVNDARSALSILERLIKRRFFRIFKLVLDAECPFNVAQKICVSGGCTICQCDDSQIPSVFKTVPVEEFVNRKQLDGFSRCAEKENFIGNERLSGLTKMKYILSPTKFKNPVYVDMQINGPSYTSYKGGKIWELIYDVEPTINCDFVNDVTRHYVSKKRRQECVELNNYNRIISGMQTNIQVLSSEYHTQLKLPQNGVKNEKKDQSNGIVRNDVEWTYDLDYFRDTISSYPDRIENLYFTFSVLLKSVCNLRPILQECSCDTGDESSDFATRADLIQLLNNTYSVCREEFIDKIFFYKTSSQINNMIQNLDNILDCVTCEKCKLHGKVKMTALRLALQVSTHNGNVIALERNEVTALINALYYFSKSITIVELFQWRLNLLRIKFFGAILALLSLIYYLKRYEKSRRSNNNFQKTKYDSKKLN